MVAGGGSPGVLLGDGIGDGFSGESVSGELRVQVVRFTPLELSFMPDGLETELKLDEPLCSCNGSGKLGTWVEPGPGFEVRHDRPCPCLHIVVRPEKRSIVESELNSHFMEVREEGRLCGCLWCNARRKQLAINPVAGLK